MTPPLDVRTSEFEINIIICDIINMKNGRNTAGQFTAGNSGRPKGSRNKATVAIESLLQGQAEALTQKAVTKALDGDSVALRLCMERIAPAPRDNTVQFSLPPYDNLQRCLRGRRKRSQSRKRWRTTPIEATRVMGLIDSFRRILELTDIENRLKALEHEFSTAWKRVSHASLQKFLKR